MFFRLSKFKKLTGFVKLIVKKAVDNFLRLNANFLSIIKINNKLKFSQLTHQSN